MSGNFAMVCTVESGEIVTTSDQDHHGLNQILVQDDHDNPGDPVVLAETGSALRVNNNSHELTNDDDEDEENDSDNLTEDNRANFMVRKSTQFQLIFCSELT